MLIRLRASNHHQFSIRAAITDNYKEWALRSGVVCNIEIGMFLIVLCCQLLCSREATSQGFGGIQAFRLAWCFVSCFWLCGCIRYTILPIFGFLLFLFCSSTWGPRRAKTSIKGLLGAAGTPRRVMQARTRGWTFDLPRKSYKSMGSNFVKSKFEPIGANSIRIYVGPSGINDSSNRKVVGGFPLIENGNQFHVKIL